MIFILISPNKPLWWYLKSNFWFISSVLTVFSLSIFILFWLMRHLFSNFDIFRWLHLECDVSFNWHTFSLLAFFNYFIILLLRNLYFIILFERALNDSYLFIGIFDFFRILTKIYILFAHNTRNFCTREQLILLYFLSKTT